MSQQHEPASSNDPHVGDSSYTKAKNPISDFDPLVASAIESQAQDRKIRGGFFNTYRVLICLWMAVVCLCLVAEAILTVWYGRELFSDDLLKWLAGPISVGLFGGAVVQHLVASRR